MQPRACVSLLPPAALRVGPMAAQAGLLARGSRPRSAFPGMNPVADGGRLSAHSCGGSHGSGPRRGCPYRVPF